MNDINTTKEVLGYFQELTWTNIDASFTVVSILLTLLTLFTVIKNYFYNKKQLQVVEVYFNLISNNREVPVDIYLSRKDCRRSEVQGILRTKLIKGRTFYEVDYLANKKYVEQIFLIQTAKSNKLTIYLQDDELSQFGLEK
jgi:hypothetical protein